MRKLNVKSPKMIRQVCSSFFRHIKRCSFTAACHWMIFLFRSFIFTSFAKIIEFKILLDYLGIQEGEKICDLGCGYGGNDILLSLKGTRICGVDIDRDTLINAKNDAERLRVNVDYCVCDLNNALCFKSQAFDKAVSYCVLEHLSDPEQFLNEANRILRPKGVLALSVDSFSYGHVPCDLMDVHRRVCKVKKYYTKTEAELLLHKCNFSVERCSFSIKSPVSGMLFEMLLRTYFSSELLGQSAPLRLFKLFTPAVLLVCMISDCLCDDKNGGYWLMLLAVKGK